MIADSARLALPSEASAVAAVQRRAWAQQLPPEVYETLLEDLDPDTMAAGWLSAITRPPLATLRVLVAVSGDQLVGFAAVGPATDPDLDPSTDGVVAEFAIDPRAQRRGHGSRLLNAVADTMRADGFQRATWWVRATDDILRSYLTSTGWEADGAHRVIGTEDERTRLKMIRLHTALA